MGFIIHTFDSGKGRPFEQQPAGAGIKLEVGTALTLTAGKLALAAGTTAPSYFSMTERAATVDGEGIPVVRADRTVIYETPLTADFSAIAPGVKATISADGNGMTATTTGGVVEVVNYDGTVTGSKVRVRVV